MNLQFEVATKKGRTKMANEVAQHREQISAGEDSAVNTVGIF